MPDHFDHPRRLPQNCPGAFYAVGDDGCSDCLSCGEPEDAAPALLYPRQADDDWETHFVQQPQTTAEVERACAAVKECCVFALRYGGQDRAIIGRLGNNPDYCDYVEDKRGALVLTVNPDGTLKRFALRMAKRLRPGYEPSLWDWLGFS